MRAKQENKLSMYYAVQKVCSENIGVWNVLPAFVTAFDEFKTNIGKIEEALEAQETNIKGFSLSKDAYEDQMIDKALEIANGVFAYASDINDLTLKSKVDFSRSDLKQARDTIVIQRCQLIHSEASAILKSLGNYGITDVELKDLQMKIDAFALILAAPRTAITERKGATDEIGKLLHKVDGILTDKLDKLAEKFKVPSPEFYRLFFDARITVTLGTRHEDPGTPPSPEKPTGK